MAYCYILLSGSYFLTQKPNYGFLELTSDKDTKDKTYVEYNVSYGVTMPQNHRINLIHSLIFKLCILIGLPFFVLNCKLSFDKVNYTTLHGCH